MKTLKITLAMLVLSSALVGCSKEEPVSTKTGEVTAPATPAATTKGGPAVGGMGVADAQVNPALQNPDARLGSKGGG
jgi:hypothetical protein